MRHFEGQNKLSTKHLKGTRKASERHLLVLKLQGVILIPLGMDKHEMIFLTFIYF